MEVTTAIVNEFVIASENAGKAAEIEKIFSAARPGVKILLPSQLGVRIDYPPEGDNYLANAVAKARAAMQATGRPALGDDSGLEVDALGGRPGVHSARYAETDPERIARLLQEMSRGPVASRSARFRALAAVVFPDGREITAEGIWEGGIAMEPAGAGGFGYDPIFVDLELGLTAAQLAPAEKSARSHRGKAFRALAARLVEIA